MKNDPVISLIDLAIGYGGKVVLDKINLELHSGQLVCFMGPNGSGKSTLIKTICQFISPLKGDILIEGTPVQTWARKELSRKFSVVLTDALNAGQLTGRDLVSTGRYPYTGWSGRLTNSDWKAVDESMEKTGTTELADNPFYEMSDGQRQKIMITRALCQETPVIILDEPTAHLDLNNRVAIVTLLRDLAHDEGRSVLMATHELDLALQLSDSLWLAAPKQSVLEGIPEDLVLNGTIDRVFQFKGYDLKTGSVHPRKTGRKVKLTGAGHICLWTKNALERNGFELDDNAEINIEILPGADTCWQIGQQEVKTVASLLQLLNRHFSRD